MCIYIPHCCIVSCVYIERYLLTELLNSSSHYLFFQVYNLLTGHFCWTFRNCSFVEISTFLLCLVSAPQLWIYINFCIKTIKLYYKVNFVISAALNSNWVIWMISLYVSLNLYRYKTLEKNVVYVLIMNLKIGSWQLFSCKNKKRVISALKIT